MHLRLIRFLSLEEYARLKPNFPKFYPRTTQMSKLQLRAFRAEKYLKAKEKTYFCLSSGWHHSLNGKLFEANNKFGCLLFLISCVLSCILNYATSV